MNEQLVAKYMKSLEISREEAIELIRSDEEVDRMTSSKEINSDLTDEQKKATKQARQADRKPTVYKFEKKERKANNSKRELIEVLRKAVNENGGTDVDVTNIEREIVFKYDGVKYKVVLSQPRK